MFRAAPFEITTTGNNSKQLYSKWQLVILSYNGITYNKENERWHLLLKEPDMNLKE